MLAAIGWGALAASSLVLGALLALGRRWPDQGGTALALGVFLDGIPEQLVPGIALASGEPVSVGLLVAIFVSNLPEAIGASSDMLGRTR